MNAVEILSHCRNSGIALAVDAEGKLHVRGNKDGIATLREDIKAHKAELVAILQAPLTVMSQALDTPADGSTFGYRRGIPPRSRWDWRSDAVPNMTLWLHLEPPTGARSAHGNLTDPRELASTGADIGGSEACGAMGIALGLILASTF
jgi:hypothetical protein